MRQICCKRRKEQQELRGNPSHSKATRTWLRRSRAAASVASCKEAAILHIFTWARQLRRPSSGQWAKAAQARSFKSAKDVKQTGKRSKQLNLWINQVTALDQNCPFLSQAFENNGDTLSQITTPSVKTRTRKHQVIAALRSQVVCTVRRS